MISPLLLITLIIVSFPLPSSCQLYVKSSTAANASSPGSLQYYLCGNGSQLLPSISYLSLSTSSHHTFLAGTFCLLQSHRYRSINIMSITIASDNPFKPAIIVCSNGALHPTRGLGFLDIPSLTLNNIQFHHCGGRLSSAAVTGINKSTIYFPPGQTAVLLINLCRSVKIIKTTISGTYYGYALIIASSYDVLLDTVTITSYKSSPYCSIEHLNNWECSGSGLLLLYNIYVKLELPQKILNISNVVISGNTNYYSSFDVEKFIQNQSPILGVGGLTLLLIDGGSYPTSIIFKNIKVKDNIGGGGLLVYFLISLDKTIFPFDAKNNPAIDFTNVLFSNNSLTRQGNGVGLAVYIISKAQAFFGNTPCIICIRNSSFTGQSINYEKNMLGGGIYIALSLNTSSIPPILLDWTIFLENTVNKSGSAIYVHNFPLSEDYWVKKEDQQADVTLILKDNYFSGSGFYPMHTSRLFYTDVSTTEFVNIRLVTIENSIFDYNFGSAVSAYSTVVKLVGNLIFKKNRAAYGGAFDLNSLSLLIIGESAQVLLNLNSAYLYGGGIYTYTTNTNYCPIHFESDKSGSLVFVNNYAFLEGDAIYSNQLKSCQGLSTRVNVSGQHKHVIMSSPPNALCFCNASYIHHCNEPKILSIYPGMTIKLNVAAIDQHSQKVYSPISATLATSNVSYDQMLHWHFGSQQNIQSVHEGTCTELEYTPSIARTNDSVFLELAVLGKMPSLNIELQFMECPIGFNDQNDMHVCSCHPFLLNNKISNNCDINTNLISLTQSNSWFGQVYIDNNTDRVVPPITPNKNNTLGYAPVCPTGYCKEGIMEINISDHDSLCYGHRTGVLCGGCIEGYTLALGTVKCKQCSSHELWILIMFAVVSVLCVVALFALRLTISDGLLGSIVFYANVNAIIFQYGVTTGWHSKIVHAFLAALNYTLNFSVCLSNHLTAILKTSLFFIYPVFLWFIVLIIVIISKYSTRISNLTAHSSIQILATLFYLSFAKLLLTAIDIFTPVTIQTPHGQYPVWYTDGNIPYWRDSGHLILCGVAFLTVFFLLFPFLLFTTFGSLILRCRFLRWVLLYVRPFVDAYQGPYRNRWKYWFGIRVWLLVYMYGCFAGLRGQRPVLMLLLQLLPLLFFTLLQTYFKPYRNTLVNLVDLSVLINLILIFVIKLFFISINEETQSWPYLEVLITAVMLTFFAIVGYHVKKLAERIRACQQCQTIVPFKQISVDRTEYEPLDGDSAQLREPLLEDYN